MTKSPNPIDVHVGKRVRMRRTSLGMSQEKLGEKLGITFQQVQKYEKGTNRVSASKLQEMADALGATVSFFFEGQPQRAGVSALQVEFATLDGLEMKVVRQLRSLKFDRDKLLAAAALGGVVAAAAAN